MNKIKKIYYLIYLPVWIIVTVGIFMLEVNSFKNFIGVMILSTGLTLDKLADKFINKVKQDE